MKKTGVKFLFCLLASISLAITACEDDEGSSCINCSSDATPDFELCRQSNGNASVNGEDTGTPYNQYLENLQETGVRCGGS